MRRYETLLLLDAELSDHAIEESITRFEALVTERAGTIANIDRWGRRRLAFEINDQFEGYYAVVDFELPPEKHADLEGQLAFVAGLVRSKTVRPGGVS